MSLLPAVDGAKAGVYVVLALAVALLLGFGLRAYNDRIRAPLRAELALAEASAKHASERAEDMAKDADREARRAEEADRARIAAVAQERQRAQADLDRSRAGFDQRLRAALASACAVRLRPDGLPGPAAGGAPGAAPAGVLAGPNDRGVDARLSELVEAMERRELDFAQCRASLPVIGERIGPNARMVERNGRQQSK